MTRIRNGHATLCAGASGSRKTAVTATTNRTSRTYLGRLEAQSGDPLAALDYLTSAIRNYHDSGNTTVIRIPLAVLAALLHRLGRDEPAATIAGYALSPVTRRWLPELSTAISQLREVLGEQTYESLASRGKSMSISAMAAYAYDQIDQARAELEQLR